MAPLDPLNANRPMSRINSYNRSWATSTTSTETVAVSQEEVMYEWPPSPPKPATRIMTAHEKRMALIQQALEQPYDDDGPSAPMSIPQKRQNSFDEKPQVTKKPRVLPWEIETSRMKKRGAVGEARNTPPMEPVKEEQRILLSNEQSQILQLVLQGQSVFFTGSAGTGKSVLLREIIKAIRKAHQKDGDALAITASTGIAACNIGGTTLHSFAGIGLGEGSVADLIKNIKKNKKASTRWMRTKVLIIDEISMVDGNLFDKLAQIACALRKNPKPFGGIQIIVTGDFFQLPPVTKGREQAKFAFEADKWNECVSRTFNLTQVFRQKDQEFVDMLNEMRRGQLSQNSIQRFKALSRSIRYDDGIEPTELFPHRDDVDRSNRTRMDLLNGESRTFYATDGGTITNLQQREKILGNLLAPVQLTLKVGSQVMLIKNKSDDNLLVNGSMGRVLGFLSRVEWNIRGFDFYNVPDPESEAAAKMKAAGKENEGFQSPVVEFNVPGSPIGRQILVEPDSWKVESNGEVQASRSQVPLILAWAMSIHKSQGQTLDRVKVDLGRAFEMGQAYVALSRATTLAGLQVLRFDPSRVRAHPRVVAWSKTLESLRATS